VDGDLVAYATLGMPVDHKRKIKCNCEEEAIATKRSNYESEMFQDEILRK